MLCKYLLSPKELFYNFIAALEYQALKLPSDFFSFSIIADNYDFNSDVRGFFTQTIAKF